MSAFDTTVNVIGTSLAAPSEEQLKTGETPALEIRLTIGQILPFSAGPGQPPVVAPVGTIRYGLDRDAAIEFFKTGLEEAEKLPPPSKLEVASSLNGIDEAAKNLERITGNK